MPQKKDVPCPKCEETKWVIVEEATLNHKQFKCVQCGWMWEVKINQEEKLK